MHALVITLAVALASRIDPTPILQVDRRLVMPAWLFVSSVPPAPVQTSRFIEQSPQSPVPVVTPPASGDSPAAPVEEPSGIEPETGTTGTADGAEDGIAGGLDVGLVGKTASSGSGLPGPLRIGGTLRSPRKIKDVRPVYPQIAVLDQARGTVIIEITIGIDGRVQEARIVHSVPHLDEAALEAVRQWEYEPTRVNGVLVALAMTVIVNFTIQ